MPRRAVSPTPTPAGERPRLTLLSGGADVAAMSSDRPHKRGVWRQRFRSAAGNVVLVSVDRYGRRVEEYEVLPDENEWTDAEIMRRTLDERDPMPALRLVRGGR